MNELGRTPTNDRGQGDAALVGRFRQAGTKKARVAVFDAMVREHRDEVLGWCAERLWPDADAAVDAARDVLIVAYLAMADPAKLARPDRLRDWLLGIAADSGLASGLRVGIEAIDWSALQARIAVDTPGKPDMRDTPDRRAWMQRWLEQIVVTLPESRQQMYDLFVRRALDSRIAARELGTDAAVARRLRRENREAILRAFEVTALAAAEAVQDWLKAETPGCAELWAIVAGAQDDGGLREGVQRGMVVLPADLRVTVASHVGQCDTCRDRRDDCMAQFAPELLPILAGTELNEQVVEDLRMMPERPRSRRASPVGDTRGGSGARSRTAPAGTTKAVIARRSAVAAGAGSLLILLVAGFVRPGFFVGTAASEPGGSSPASSTAPASGGLGGNGSPQMTGKSVEVSGLPVPTAVESSKARRSSGGHGGSAAPASASPTQPGQSAAPPSSASPSAQPTSAFPSASSPSTPTPSSSSSPTPVRSTPPPSHSATPTPTPTPTRTPTPTPTATPTPTQTPTPTPTTSDLSAAPSPTVEPSTAAPSSPAPSTSAVS